MKTKEQKRQEAHERQERHDATMREWNAEFEALHFRSIKQYPCCLSCKHLARGLEDVWCSLLASLGREEADCVSFDTVCDKYEEC